MAKKVRRDGALGPDSQKENKPEQPKGEQATEKPQENDANQPDNSAEPAQKVTEATGNTPPEPGAKPMVGPKQEADLIKEVYTGTAEKTVQESSWVRDTLIKPYNPDPLVQRSWDYKIYEEMLEDDQISVALQIKKDLVIGSGWTIQADEDQGEIKDFLEWALSDETDRPLSEILEEVIQSYEYGFSVSEKIFRTGDDGKLFLKDIKPRHPGTWVLHTDKHGNVTKYEQRGRNESLDINPESVIHYINNPRHQNPYGKSDLFTAYAAYMAKRHVTRFYAIYLEKAASPIPVASYDRRAPQEAVNDVYEAIKKFQTRTALAIPKEIEMQFLEAKSNGEAYVKGINLFNMFIGRALFIPDLLGFQGAETTGGAQALGREQVGVFYRHIDKRRTVLERVVNHHIIRALTLYNFGKVDKFPQFKFNPLSDEDVMKYADLWIKAVQGKNWVPTPEEINHFRDLVKFPKTENEVQAVMPLPVDGQQPVQPDQNVPHGTMPNEEQPGDTDTAARGGAAAGEDTAGEELGDDKAGREAGDAEADGGADKGDEQTLKPGETKDQPGSDDSDKGIGREAGQDDKSVPAAVSAQKPVAVGPAGATSGKTNVGGMGQPPSAGAPAQQKPGQPGAKPAGAVLQPAAGQPGKPGAAPAPAGPQQPVQPIGAPGTAGASAGGEKAQDNVLNGAQIASLVEIVRAVVAGEIPRDSALGIIEISYLIPRAKAEVILGTAGNGFEPPKPEPMPGFGDKGGFGGEENPEDPNDKPPGGGGGKVPGNFPGKAGAPAEKASGGNKPAGDGVSSKPGAPEAKEKDGKKPFAYDSTPGSYAQKVDFARAEQLLEHTAASVLSEARPIIADIFEDLYDQVQRKRIIENKNLDKADSIDLKYLKRLQLVLKKNFRKLYQASAGEAKAELKKQFALCGHDHAEAFAKPLPADEFLAFLEQESFRFIGEWEYRVTQTTKNELIKAIKDGRPLSEVISVLDNEGVQLAEESLERYARTKSTEVYNKGRKEVFESSGVVSAYQYSAILDSQTSEICAGLHGAIFEKGSEPTPPMHFNCRSVLVPITKFEEYETTRRANDADETEINEFIEANIGKGFPRN